MGNLWNFQMNDTHHRSCIDKWDTDQVGSSKSNNYYNHHQAFFSTNLSSILSSVTETDNDSKIYTSRSIIRSAASLPNQTHRTHINRASRHKTDRSHRSRSFTIASLRLATSFTIDACVSRLRPLLSPPTNRRSRCGRVVLSDFRRGISGIVPMLSLGEYTRRDRVESENHRTRPKGKEL